MAGIKGLGSQCLSFATKWSQDVSQLLAFVLSGIRIVGTANTPLSGVVVVCVTTTCEHEHNLVGQCLGVEHLDLDIMAALNIVNGIGMPR